MAIGYSLRGKTNGVTSLSGKTNSSASLSANIDEGDSLSGQTAEKESLSGKSNGKSELAGGMDYVEKGDPGDSAYDIAVKEGFKGTVAEWLASLKGKDGSTPSIIDGYWYIDGKNTYVKAQGDKGDPYTLNDNDKRSIAETVEREIEIWRYQPKKDDTLETESKEVVGAINEVSGAINYLLPNITGNTWIMYDDLNKATPFEDTFNFTSNGESFVGMRGYLYRYVNGDGVEFEWYRLNYRRSDGSGKEVYADDRGGWIDNAYKTVITDELNISSLVGKATKKIPAISERLTTEAKTVVGAINEVYAKSGIVVGYKKPETDEWYEDMEFTLSIPKTPFTICVDLSDEEVYFRLAGATIFKLSDLVGNKLDPVWGGITNFLDGAGDFATAVKDRIMDFFTKENITALETEQKIIPLAVNEVNTKVKDVVEGRRKTVASTSDKLAQARKITFTGDVSGEMTFDGSNDESVNLSVLGGTGGGTGGKDGLSTYLYNGVFVTPLALKPIVTAVDIADITIPSGRELQVGDFLIDTEGTLASVSGIAENLVYYKVEMSLKGEGGDTSNLPTFEKINLIDTGTGSVQGVWIADGYGFGWEDQAYIEGGDFASAQDVTYCTRVPLVAGENITLEADEENKVIKINAKGGGSAPSVSLIGTWTVIDNPEIPTSDLPLEFTSNGVNYVAIGYTSQGSSSWGINALSYQVPEGYYDAAYVNNPSGSYGISHGWIGEGYKYLTVTKEPTDTNAIAWLGNNTDAPKITPSSSGNGFEMPQIRFVGMPCNGFFGFVDWSQINGDEIQTHEEVKFTIEIVGGGALQVGDTLQICRMASYGRWCDNNSIARPNKRKLRRLIEYAITEEDLDKRFITITVPYNAKGIKLLTKAPMRKCDPSPIYFRIRRPMGEINSGGNGGGMTVDAQFSNVVSVLKSSMHYEGIDEHGSPVAFYQIYTM